MSSFFTSVKNATSVSYPEREKPTSLKIHNDTDSFLRTNARNFSSTFTHVSHLEEPEPGTFKIRFQEISSTKDGKENYLSSIILMKEYTAQNTSLFRKRCEDYIMMKKGDIGANFSEIITRYNQQGHLNSKIIHPNIIKNVNANRPGSFFNNFSNNASSVGISSVSDNNVNFFRSATGQNPIGSNFEKKPNDINTSFNRPNVSSTPVQGNAYFSKFAQTNQPQATNVKAPFLNSNESQQPKQGLFSTNTNTPTVQQPTNNSGVSFFGNTNLTTNSNQTASFCPAQKSLPAAGNNFFSSNTTNQTAQAFSFTKSPNNYIQPQPVTYATNNVQKDSFFSHANANANVSSFEKNQQPTLLTNNSVSASFPSSQPTNTIPQQNYFGQPPISPFYPPFQMYPYPPYMPYPYIPYNGNFEIVQKHSSTGPLEYFQASSDCKDREKNIEQAFKQDFRKKMGDIERENYFLQKYMANLKSDVSLPEDSFKSLKPLIRGSRSLKTKINVPIIRGRSRDIQKSVFLSKETEVGISANQTLLSKAIKGDFTKNSQTEGLIKLKIAINYVDSIIYLDLVTVNKNLTIKELKAYVAKQIPRCEKSFEEMIEISKFLFDNDIFNDDVRLKSIENLEMREIRMIVDLRVGLSQKRESAGFSQPSQKSYTPVFTKTGYEISPPLGKLQRLNEKELSSVENFTVRNEFGKIKFAEPVDLRNANIDLWVVIKKESVEIYPEDLFDDVTKPEPGCGLNCPAYITLYHIFSKKPEEAHLFIKKLKVMCESQFAEFIKYNSDSGKYKFKVSHF